MTRTSKHEVASSEDDSNGTTGSEKQLPKELPAEGKESMHESISHEAIEEEFPEDEFDQVDEDFQGHQTSGEIESVTGFDPTHAINEGIPLEILTEEELDLREIEELEGMLPESVCGRDDRVKICPATAFPWRAVCKLIITTAAGGVGGCTGWFIGPRTVMTAGHCVHGSGGWARRIEVIPGMCSSSRPFGSQVGTSFRSVKGWVKDRDWRYDYGAIILPNNNLGNRVGYFGFARLSSATLRNLLVNNAGYAGDKPFGTLWFNAGRITRVTSRKIYYMVDTFGGHSGSPVWRYVYHNGRWQRHGVGIHAYGGCPNSATRIVKPVFDNMLSWRKLGLSS